MDIEALVSKLQELRELNREKANTTVALAGIEVSATGHRSRKARKVSAETRAFYNGMAEAYGAAVLLVIAEANRKDGK